MTYLKTFAIAALFASLAACNTFDTPNDYTGKPYTGRDPVTGVSASLNDINRCKDNGGVKNINPVASLGGGFYPADCMRPKS